jgi:hypothetical protein
LRNKDDLVRYSKSFEIARERESIKKITPNEFSLLPSLDFLVAYASVALCATVAISQC